MDTANAYSYTLVLLAVILFFAYVLSGPLGRLWVWFGTASGTIWLILQSPLQTFLPEEVADFLAKVSAYLVPEKAGSLTLAIRNAASGFMPEIFDTYIGMYKDWAFTYDPAASAASGLILGLKLSGMSIFVPLLAALYINAELLLGLLVVNIIMRIVSRLMTNRKEEKKQLIAAEKAEKERAEAAAKEKEEREKRVLQAFNPYLPSWEYVPDGEPRLFGDRVYVYGSHDAFEGADFCVNDYVCWSAPADNLADWKMEGVIYRKNQDPKNPDGKKRMCAPDVVQGPDGRYYLYYEFADLTITSVAVCGTPAGKYEFYGYIQKKDGTPYGAKKGEVNLFDPGVLVDDDGSVYMFTGFSPAPGFLKTAMGMRGMKIDGGYCIALEPDMITMKSDPVRVIPGPDAAKGTSFDGHAFFEASSPRKIAGRYYMVYSSVLSHELCYAVSDAPDRDYTYGGTIVSIGDIGYQGRGPKDAVNYTGNTHGGLVCVNGQWYIFYHRQTNQQKCARQGCAEAVAICADGSIPQVEITSCGLNGGPLLGKGTYEARIACHLTSARGTFAYVKTHEKDKKHRHPYFTQSGKDREKNPDQYIANMKRGATAGFKYFSFDEPDGLRRITINVHSDGKGTMEVRTAIDGPVIASIPVKPSASWEDFAAQTTQKITGVQALYFTYRGRGRLEFNRFTLE